MFSVVCKLWLLLRAAGRPCPAPAGCQGTLTLDVAEPEPGVAAVQAREASGSRASVSLAVTDTAQTSRLGMLRREPSEPQRGAAVLAHGEGVSRVASASAALFDSSVAPPPGGISCTTDQAAYAVMTDSSLLLIDMGPSTMSGKTEVRRLTPSSQYKSFKEESPIQTRLHLTAGTTDNGEWTFLTDGADNLLAVNSGLTATNMTEVHRLKYDATNPYQEFDVQVATALPHRTTFDEWEFLLDSMSNLLVIKKGPSTPSTMTEVHKMSASNSWQLFSLRAATGLHLSASTNNHGDWAFLLDGADNLLCIRRPSVDDPTVVVKRLTAGSNYQSFDIEKGGATLPSYPNAHADVHWVFQLDPQDDLLCIKEGPITVQGYTEIHRLSMASNYTAFNLRQNRTGAPCRTPFFVDAGGSR